MSKAHPDGYGECLKDPDVIPSKGRPQERYKTFMEKIREKQNIGCSHCGQHDHDVASCTNKHIPRAQFHKNTTKGKQSAGVPSAAKGLPSKNQKGGKQTAGEKRSAQKDTTGAS